MNRKKINEELLFERIKKLENDCNGIKYLENRIRVLEFKIENPLGIKIEGYKNKSESFDGRCFSMLDYFSVSGDLCSNQNNKIKFIKNNEIKELICPFCGEYELLKNGNIIVKENGKKYTYKFDIELETFIILKEEKLVEKKNKVSTKANSKTKTTANTKRKVGRQRKESK